MAIKKRALKMIKNIEHYLQHEIETGDRARLNSVYHDFTELQELYMEGLPKRRYTVYGEIFDGMLRATDIIAETEDFDAQGETLPLCLELLQFVKAETEKEHYFKKEIIFLPYKASMWDSLESIWRTAEADKENCIAYVIPIPYADRRHDTTVAAWHCDRDLFPNDVPVLNWEEYDLQEMHPDAIFIHNPYDNRNNVITIDERYYAEKLRLCTELLVYCPYFVTSGGMGEGQGDCAIFPYVDYIIVQSEGLRNFYDPSVPRDKLIPLGSPKLDRVIRFCKNPPEPPDAWKQRIHGRKVYFYNTSINGALWDTAAFLKKMKYVFSLFSGRDDVCLIWRPHPLLSASLSSMREAAVPYYEKLKEIFIRNNIGIYDDTPDIEKTIALSDVYVGDGATSVTMLFAIVGKPMFILDNNIHELPGADDWRGNMLTEATFQGQDDWIVTPTNHLYHRQNGRYRYVCDLCDYHYGSYYLKVIEIDGKAYVCPANAQDILVVSNEKIEERIELKREIDIWGAFAQAWQAGQYIFLIPLLYPAIVRYDTRTKRLSYVRGQNEVFVRNIHDEWCIGGSCVWRDELLIASPDSADLLRVNVETLKAEKENIGSSNGGCAFMAADGDDIWLIPRNGYDVLCWRPRTDRLREYSARPEGFQPHHYLYHFECDYLPFGTPALDDKYVYLPPYWGNQFLRLDKKTGIVEKWETTLVPSNKTKSSYYAPFAIGGFVRDTGNGHWRFFYWPERKLYDVDIRSAECQEVPIILADDALQHEKAGFTEQSEWLRYGCMENALHTLPELLDGALPGDAHDKERQIRDYCEVAANPDGTAGEKIYEFVIQKLIEK